MTGLSTALDLTLTGREISAQEAYRLQLVNKVVSHKDLIATAEAYAEKMISNSQQAIRSAKETIVDVVVRTLTDALRVEAINAYSNLGDCSQARDCLAQFSSKEENNKIE